MAAEHIERIFLEMTQTSPCLGHLLRKSAKLIRARVLRQKRLINTTNNNPNLLPVEEGEGGAKVVRVVEALHPLLHLLAVAGVATMACRLEGDAEGEEEQV